MGKSDSSKTRVAPVFDHLLNSDHSGASWLGRLLRLGTRADVAAIPKNLGMFDPKHLPSWGPKNECRLPPPLKLLEWLVYNISCESVDKSCDKGETLKKRQALACDDPEVLCEALCRLKAGEIKSGSGKWWVLEGLSSPDAFLETETLVLVVEGKRTEGSPTNDTKWMQYRPQLIRHMDCAREIANGRAVLGLLLVEGESLDPMSAPEKWLRAAEKDLRPDMLLKSLPHRSDEERKEIEAGGLGVATWQRVCDEFAIGWPPVQDTV